MIRVLVVDDEAPARRKVRLLLAREPDVEVVGEAADGADAIALIGRERPDLVLLDIQMPRLDGFGVIDRVGVDRMPLVVFITAFDEHAVRAFDVHAFDYLLKPFAPARFAAAIERARRQLARPAELDDLGSRIGRLLAALTPGAGYLRHVVAERSPQREVLLRIEAIDRFHSEGNYLRIRSEGTDYLRRGTLTDVEQRLDPAQFVRISRSDIVRLGAVAEFQPWFHGDYRVRMRDGTLLNWSRRYRTRPDLGR